MQEVAPGVYVAPRLKKAVRERVWNVLLDWQELIPEDGGVVLLWKSRQAPSGLGVRLLGFPKKELVEHEGLWLTYAGLIAAHDAGELMELAEHEEPAFEADDPTLDLGPAPGLDAEQHDE
jgi:CRISPR-associated protein Cas2